MKIVYRSNQRTIGFLIFSLITAIISAFHTNAQNVELTDLVMGKAIVTSPTSVKMLPGFNAVEGCAFKAYIGTAQAQAATYDPTNSVINNPTSGSGSVNYIKTTTYRDPSEMSDPKILESYTYFDGLGRPIQTVNVGASPTGEDIIQPILYDNFGREKIKTLPYSESTSGDFRDEVDQATVNAYYQQGTLAGVEPDNRAFTEMGFDNSPLNRVISQTGPGENWESVTVAFNYLTNTTTVSGWTVDNEYNFTAHNFPLRSLYVTEIVDEDGQVTREYKDFQGRIVQKSSKINDTWKRTAYVYDDFGLLRCVVPPMATDPNTDNDLCYYYKYDSRNRMIEKKIPGGGIVSMVYDKRDRLRCTRNSMQDFNDEWSFIQYDALNRPVVNGIIKNYDLSPEDVKAAIDAVSDYSETRNNTSAYFGYNHASFPKSDLTVEVLNVTYYDDYDFIIPSINPGNELLSATYGDPYNFAGDIDHSPVGQVTGSMTRVQSPTDNYTVPDPILYTVIYYDKYGHPLRTISENHLNGIDVVSSEYEKITYLTTRSKQQHFKNGQQAIALETTLKYDHTGRLLSTLLQVNDQEPFTMNAMEYNQLGQLHTKYLHSDATSGTRMFTQKLDYDYNIRGWLTKINDPDLVGENDLFGMQLCYHTTDDMGGLNSAPGYFNGNIAGMKWSIKNEATRGFVFTYDELNRLKSTNYAEGSSLNTRIGYFAESVTSYDDHGNIKGLKRKYNNELVDNLTYYYSSKSNRINTISDNLLFPDAAGINDYPGNSQQYLYDENGNIKYDGSRDAELSYHNILNLPMEVDFTDGSIYYHYTAAGTKLIKHVRKNLTENIYSHYLGNIIYEGNKLSQIITAEGRLIPVETTSGLKFVPEYNLKDHLGNNRVTFMGKSIGGSSIEIMQTNNYYPFGLTMTQNNYSPTDFSRNKYLYNGKEIQNDEFGNDQFFGLLDYGARFYDPQIGRWHSVDPAAELSRKLSPYAYCFNNPIKYVDKDGLIPIDEIVKGGERGSKFGPRILGGNTYHYGLDLKTGGQTGLQVRAAAAGTVKIIKWDSNAPESKKVGYGYYIVIDHGNGYYSYYGHLRAGSAMVKQGQKVENGEVLALSGNTGHSTGPHLHLGFKGPDGKFLDPEPIDDLQEFIDNGYQVKEEAVNKDNPTNIPEAVCTAKATNRPKSLEARIEDMLWSSVRPNDFGNTGRYNKPGRTTDQYYNDQFLKLYYAP